MGPNDEDLLAQDGDTDAEGDEELDAGDTSVDPDEDLGDDGQGAADEDGDDQGGKDALGSDDGKAGQGPAEVKRGNPEFGRLRRERREATEKAERLERELQETRRSVQQRDSGPSLADRRKAELAEAAERDRLDGTARYWETRLRHQSEDTDARFGMLQNQFADTADRQSFDRLCASHPAVAKIADRVEQEIANFRRNGQVPPTRDAAARYILGDMALKSAGANLGRQRKKGEEAVARERARAPGNRGGSDVPRNQSRNNDSKSARENRLKDQFI